MQDEPSRSAWDGGGLFFLCKDGYVSCSSPQIIVSSMHAFYDSIPRSDRAHVHVRTLTIRHPCTKFVSIVGDKCIPDLPDTRICSSCVGKARLSLRSWSGDWVESERSKVGPSSLTLTKKLALTALQLQN